MEKIYIALFRGINVGGKNLLKMKELVELFQKLGLQNVKTYIQSGNVVFTHKKKGKELIENLETLSQKITKTIQKNYHFEPKVLILALQKFEKIVALNPFLEKENISKTVHVSFLDKIPTKPDLEALEALKQKKEEFSLIEDIFYFYAPEGIGRSKLAAQLEKKLGVCATGRNWRSVCKIQELANNIGSDSK